MSSKVNSKNDLDPKKFKFISSTLDRTLESTNRRLEELNLRSFQFLHKNRERYPSEYKEAYRIFKTTLSEIFEKLETEILAEVLK